MANILVSSDDIRSAMKNHVMNVAAPKTSGATSKKISKKAAEVQKNSRIYGKHVAGEKNQVCPFCNKKFEKAGLHSPYCFGNPNRVPGNRAKDAAPIRSDSITMISDGEIAMRIVTESMLKYCSADVFIYNAELFSEWSKLTQKILNIK